MEPGTCHCRFGVPDDKQPSAPQRALVKHIHVNVSRPFIPRRRYSRSNAKLLLHISILPLQARPVEICRCDGTEFNTLPFERMPVAIAHGVLIRIKGTVFRYTGQPMPPISSDLKPCLSSGSSDGCDVDYFGSRKMREESLRPSSRHTITGLEKLITRQAQPRALSSFSPGQRGHHYSKSSARANSSPLRAHVYASIAALPFSASR